MPKAAKIDGCAKTSPFSADDIDKDDEMRFGDTVMSLELKSCMCQTMEGEGMQSLSILMTKHDMY